MALADLFSFFAAAPSEPRVRELAERLTVLFIPMLNPDGRSASSAATRRAST